MIKKLLSIFLTITVIISSLTVITYADEEEWEEIEIPKSRELSPEEQKAIDELISPYLHDFGDESFNSYWSIFLNELGYMYLHPEEKENGDYNYGRLFSDIAIEHSAEDFEDYTNQSEEVFLEMDSFQQRIWSTFYLNVMQSTTNYGGNSATSSWGRFKNSIYYDYAFYSDDYFLRGLNCGTYLLAQSYKAVMQWLYYNYINTGEWLNPVTGKTSSEEMGLVSPNESISQENAEDHGNSDDGDDKKGILKNLGENLKENKVTFIILAILIIGFLGVVLVRKSKSVDKK